MRISHASITRQAVYEMQRSFSRMSSLRLSLSSGQRISSFADDPSGLGSIRRFGTLQAANEQYTRNLGSARTFLESADSNLQGMSGVMAKLREVLIRETGALANPESNASAAVELEGLREQMLALVNAEVEGTYIFGGFRTDAPPFRLDGNGVVYEGDDNVQAVQVGASLRIPVSIAGQEMLGSNVALLGGNADLLPRVTGATSLSSLNEGAGMALGSITLKDGTALPVEVDLSTAATVQDVIDAINGAGTGITARISDDERGITLDSGDPIAVGEVDGSTAADLGLLGTDAGTLEGTDIRASLMGSTALTDIAAFDGSLPLGTIQIEIGDTITDVDLSAALTIDDMRGTIQSLVPQMDLDITNGFLSLQLNQADPFRVYSPPGDTTSQRLGLDGDASPARLFDLFEDAIDALKSGDTLRIRQGMVEVEDVHAHLLELNVRIGARQQTLDQTERLLLGRSEALALQRSRIEDTDIISAASNLSFAETAYQASLASSSRLFSLSLVNYL